jgi:hypothetical protein
MAHTLATVLEFAIAAIHIFSKLNNRTIITKKDFKSCRVKNFRDAKNGISIFLKFLYLSKNIDTHVYCISPAELQYVFFIYGSCFPIDPKLSKQ